MVEEEGEKGREVRRKGGGEDGWEESKEGMEEGREEGGDYGREKGRGYGRVWSRELMVMEGDYWTPFSVTMMNDAKRRSGNNFFLSLFLSL